MYGYIEGYSDTNDIEYCIRCGEQIGAGHSDGSATCSECGCRFFAIEHEDSRPFREDDKK